MSDKVEGRNPRQPKVARDLVSAADPATAASGVIARAAGAASALSTRLGLSDAIINMLPATFVLMHADGNPAFAMALMVALVQSARGAAKLREIDEVIADTVAIERVATVEDRVVALERRLRPAQREQIGSIAEEYLRTTDELWLKCLQNALRDVVAETVDAATRKTVIAGLRFLGQAQIRELQEFETAYGGRRTTVPRDARERTAELQAALISVGMLRERVEGRMTEQSKGVTSSAAVGGILLHHQTLISITPIGRAALRMLIPPPLPPAPKAE